jgi:hypothetical protein
MDAFDGGADELDDQQVDDEDAQHRDHQHLYALGPALHNFPLMCTTRLPLRRGER